MLQHPRVELSSQESERRLDRLTTRIGSLVRAIQENDEARIEQAILGLSHRGAYSPRSCSRSARS